jgi:DNA invertase Pin-like site-specific DNA recombinase
MIIFAYFYSEPFLQSSLDISVNNILIDRIYHDLGARYELEKLINDCQKNTPNYLLIRHLEELGDSPAIVKDNYNKLTSYGLEIITLKYHNFTNMRI